MFIELLISMGLLGIIASVTIIALSPKKSLTEAKDAERAVTVREIENAITYHTIDTGALSNYNDIPIGEENARQICAQGITNNLNCLQMDSLMVTLIAIPRDLSEPCADYTGYLAYREAGFVRVRALHLGKLPGDQVTVTPGCSPEI